MAATERRRAILLAAALSFIVFAIGFVATYNAPMFLPHQGVQSVLAADSLIEGRGFRVSQDMPFAKFGPVYPLLLSWLGRAGFQITPAVYLINWASFAATLFGMFLLGRMLRIPNTAWIAAAFAIWAPNYYLIRAARPDPIVIALSLLALCAMVAYARRPGWAPLLAAAAACTVAATTRYMALLTLAPLFAVAVVLATKVTWRRRLIHLTVFEGIAALPVALWMLRNVRLTGHLTGISRVGGREFMPHYGLLGNTWGLLKTLAIDAFGYGALGIRRVVYGERPLPYPWAVVGGTLLVLVIVAAVAWRGRDRVSRYLTDDVVADDECRAAFVLTKTYTILYVVVLLTVWTLSNNDPIETRYVAPLYPFLFLGVGGLFGIVGGAMPRGARLAVAFAVLLLFGVPNVAKSAEMLTGDPPGPTFLPVTVIGSRGTNWVEPLGWKDVGPG